MYWSSEETVLALTGALFLLVVFSSFAPKVQLSPISRVAFAIGAIVFIGSAAVLSRLEDVRYPLLLWFLPAVPLAVLGVMLRDAIRAGDAGPSREVTGAEPVASTAPPSRAAFFPPVAPAAGEGGDGRVRERASDADTSPQELTDIAYGHPELRPLVAANPATPASVLEWMASLGDPAVHAAIASRAARTA